VVAGRGEVRLAVTVAGAETGTSPLTTRLKISPVKASSPIDGVRMTWTLSDSRSANVLESGVGLDQLGLAFQVLELSQ
jgi:hypothetical protein